MLQPKAAAGRIARAVGGDRAAGLQPPDDRVGKLSIQSLEYAWIIKDNIQNQMGQQGLGENTKEILEGKFCYHKSIIY